jgi:hypothetical protein
MRGMIACGFGPVIWAIVYAILNVARVVETVSVAKVAIEIISVTVLAFIAGGIGVVYKIEKLPLVAATFIHALTLYADYIVIYLMNGWLGREMLPLVIFTVCFIVGFAAIWLTVYFSTKNSANRINERLSSLKDFESKQQI